MSDGAGSGTARSPQAADGVVFVFAAGNAHPYLSVVFPANMPEVIAVGATTKTNARWDYSCTGDALDVMAPSGDVGLNGDQWTVDQLANSGWNPLITASRGDISDVDYTSKMGGTSGACPQVAGIAALLMARGHADINHAYPILKIREIITQSAIDLGDPGWDPEFGYGRADAYRALLSIIRGDVNNDTWIDNLDLAVLIDMIFFGGHATLDDRTGDWNCDGFVDSIDMGPLIDYVFFGAPPPGICFDY